MRLHESKMAPNPRRVRIFLAEKGIEVPLQDVNIGAAENRKPPFLANLRNFPQNRRLAFADPHNPIPGHRMEWTDEAFRAGRR